MNILCVLLYVHIEGVDKQILYFTLL